MVIAIAQVPPEVAVAIASWLVKPRELVRLALASKTMIESPFCTVCLHRQIRLHVPSDRQCHAWLVGDPGPPLPQSLPANLSIVLKDTFPKLHEQVCKRVETLVVKLSYYHEFAQTLVVVCGLEVLYGLSIFPNLTALELCGNRGTLFSLDLRIIAEAAPRLRTFCTTNIEIKVEDVETTPQMLQLLHLKVQNGGVPVSRMCRVCPNLESLECDRLTTEAAAAVIDWPPLRNIRVRWARCIASAIAQAIEGNRLPDLERLTLRDVRRAGWWPNVNFDELGSHGYPLRELRVPPHMLQDHWASVVSLPFLRCLRLEQYENLQLDDVSPLASLPLLEELSFGLSRVATNCRALRELTRLRVLSMTDGWIRDFIQYTPHLEAIQCAERLTNPKAHRTFQARDDGDETPPRLAWLREITISRSDTIPVTLNEYAMALLEQAPVVRMKQTEYTDLDLERMCASTKLVSLMVYGKSSYPRLDTSIWPHLLANVSGIRALRYRRLTGTVGRCPWHLRGARSLRVLEITSAGQPVVDAIGRWASTLVDLEELNLASFQGKYLHPLTALSQLRTVKIPASVSCSGLRDGIQQGRLQQLQFIVHGPDNCLHTGHYCRARE